MPTVAVTVRFDTYMGPTLTDGTVPIIPLRHTWFATMHACSRLQLPLKLSWAITIRVVIDIGKKEFSMGLTIVACSRVRHITDLLFVPPFAFQRLSNLNKISRLSDRQKEDARLLQLMSCFSKGNTDSDGDCGVFAYKAEPARLLQLMSCSSNGNAESDGDSGVLVCMAEPYTCPFKYHPVDAIWQRITCRALSLSYCGSNDVDLGGPDICLTSPSRSNPSLAMAIVSSVHFLSLSQKRKSSTCSYDKPSCNTSVNCCGDQHQLSWWNRAVYHRNSH